VGAKSDTPDRRVAEIAERQHGVVSMTQLRACGVSYDMVRRRVEKGWLHRLHQGVYAMGHAGISPQGRWMAAVLASGEGAVLSHGGAAVHWGLLRPLAGPAEVSVRTGAGRQRRAGIRLHRRAALAPTDVTRHKGIPVTTPARTVADLPGAVPARLARRARRQAEVLGLLLGEIASDRTRSDLERDFLRLCRRHALPAPEVNVRIGRWTVDFVWRDERLAVETDSYRWHRGAVAFEDDHARDFDLRRHGYSVRRFTEHQVRERPAHVAADLAEALGRAS
jgi:very-short-patch-repair endonuclease